MVQDSMDWSVTVTISHRPPESCTGPPEFPDPPSEGSSTFREREREAEFTSSQNPSRPTSLGGWSYRDNQTVGAEFDDMMNS